VEKLPDDDGRDHGKNLGKTRRKEIAAAFAKWATAALAREKARGTRKAGKKKARTEAWGRRKISHVHVELSPGAGKIVVPILGSRQMIATVLAAPLKLWKKRRRTTRGKKGRTAKKSRQPGWEGGGSCENSWKEPVSLVVAIRDPRQWEKRGGQKLRRVSINGALKRGGDRLSATHPIVKGDNSLSGRSHSPF